MECWHFLSLHPILVPCTLYHPSLYLVPYTNPFLYLVPCTNPSLYLEPCTNPSLYLVPTHPCTLYLLPTHPCTLNLVPTHPCIVNSAKEKKAMKNIHVVLPGHTLLYTWDIPDVRKELKFWIRGRESKTFLLQPQVRESTSQKGESHISDVICVVIIVQCVNIDPPPQWLQDACGKFKLPRGFKKWLVYERTARAMMSHGGSRRTDSFYSSYSAPPTPVESEVSAPPITVELWSILQLYDFR